MVPAARPPNSPAATSPPPARTGDVAPLVSVSAITIAATGNDLFIFDPVPGLSQRTVARIRLLGDYEAYLWRVTLRPRSVGFGTRASVRRWARSGPWPKVSRPRVFFGPSRR